MAKATRKSQASSTVTEQPSPNTKERKMRKSSSQPRSRGSVKAAKKTTGAKRPLRRRSTKKASRKCPTSSVKSKEARGTTLFGHYHRLNEKLNQDEPEADGESMEKPSTSRAYLHHRQLQSEATDLREESSEKSLTSDP
nr:spermatid nuclear transition protein 3 [Equus caballus]